MPLKKLPEFLPTSQSRCNSGREKVGVLDLKSKINRGRMNG